MELELTRHEAVLLIAILTFAECAAETLNPPLVRAIADLRPVRSALLMKTMREKPVAVDAVDPVGGIVEG